jgi:NADPH-dependent 2,4-dienoyl-CoA reductase/sulfur reductase-like enzyme/rhodanese-related sulfurtransferase
MKLLIVGGVAGGSSAAARARRLSEQAEIILFERGPDISFANCGLPYYIGEKVADRDKLLITTVEHFRERFNVDVRIQSSVESINRTSKTVRVRDTESGKIYDESYDKLILATGAAPLKPPIAGIDLPGIFTLRDLHDVDCIKAAVDAGAKQAVIVGAGFIGLELAENLMRRGLETTVVELQDQLLPPFDKEMTTPILDSLKANRVNVLLGESADAFEQSDKGLVVRLKSGQCLSAQLVILGVGVRPENKLAVEASLEVGPRGGIQVNDLLQTSDPDIYAAGDAIQIQDFVLGSPTQIPLGGPANRQGRIAADNIFGRNSKYRGTQGTAILGIFKMTAAMTGASEKSLVRTKTPYQKIYVHPGNHASYYPGVDLMTLKLLYSPDSGRVLGAQAVGGEGVDKRIDVLSVAIQAGMTVYDLEEMELAYAPQYGSAKDPVNMAGFVAAGKLRGDQPQLEVETLLATPESQRPLLIDVRTPEEFAHGGIPNSINIPIDQLRRRLLEIPPDSQVGCYCLVGQRGYLATRILIQNGFAAANLNGGLKTYQLFQGK